MNYITLFSIEEIAQQMIESEKAIIQANPDLTIEIGMPEMSAFTMSYTDFFNEVTTTEGLGTLSELTGEGTKARTLAFIKFHAIVANNPDLVETPRVLH